MNIPSPSLRSLHPGNKELRKFLVSGSKNLELVTSILKSQGIRQSKLENIFEFGCGCGMNIQHWDAEGLSIYGVDPDSNAIEWCKNHYPNMEFSELEIYDQLGFDDDFFDLIYAPHIFMSFTESLQDKWLQELKRVLKPGGLLIVFLRGERESFINLQEKERKQFENGELVVLNRIQTPTIDCRACHPEKYVAEHFSSFMPVIEYIPSQSFNIDDTTITVKAVCVLRKIG